MAKTTKKPVVAKNTKKNTSRWQKLVPRTPRAKFLTFLVVFAVLGGSVMAYRSFAATGAGVYTASQMTGENGAWTMQETRGVKKGYTVWYLPPNRNANPVTYIAPSYWPTIWAPYIRGCANVRTYGPAGSQSVTLTITDGQQRFTSGANLTNSADTYKKVCTNGSIKHTDPNAKVHVAASCTCGLGGNTVYVSSLSIEYFN